MEQEPVKVAVFDLNQTVYRKSSKAEFFKYVCYKKNFKFIDIFSLALYSALHKLRLINQTEFKENFFHYLDGLPPDKVKAYAAQFWNIAWSDGHFNEQLLERIEELRQQGVKIFYITGTYDVYVAPLFENQLKADAWMATETIYEEGTYKIKGKALKDEEKLRRLNEHFGSTPYRLVETYSDKKEVLFERAEKAFMIKHGEVFPYHPDQQ